MSKFRNRLRVAKKKLGVYLTEFNALRDGGLWYCVGFGALLVLGIPFLALDLATLLLTGKDLGWFPAVDPAEHGSISNEAANRDEIISLLEQQKTPALHMVKASTSPVFSKIGGAPEAPPGFTWPRWKGSPLAFLAQIDLSELGDRPVLEHLPETGRLYFFYDQEQSTWGFDPADRGSWRVLHIPENLESAPIPIPAGIARHAVFDEKRVEFRRLWNYPTVDRLNIGPNNISGEDWDAIESRRSSTFGSEPRHQIGGLPDPVQGDNMEEECQLASHGAYCGNAAGFRDPLAQELRAGSADWQLLLQLDTDDDLSMMWGDCGMLYFWIRAADLKDGNFSETWMVLQCA